jgi:hypothetical protein
MQENQLDGSGHNIGEDIQGSNLKVSGVRVLGVFFTDVYLLLLLLLGLDFCCLFEAGSCYVAQGGLKRSSCLSLVTNWDYRYVPLCLVHLVFSESGASLWMFPRTWLPHFSLLKMKFYPNPFCIHTRAKFFGVAGI